MVSRRTHELLFNTVLALPNASRMGFVPSTCDSMDSFESASDFVERLARYRISCLALSVFPAPLSPDTIND